LRASGKDSSKPQTHSKKQKQRRNRRTIGFMPLEPRVMYDGAAAASAAVAHHHADHHDIANGGGMPGGGGSPGGGVPGANGAAPGANGAPASGAGEWSYHGSSNGHWSGEQGSVGGIAGDKAPGTGPAPTVPSIVSDQNGTPGNNEAGKTTSLAADQTSGGNPSNPMPTVTTWVKDPTEIVFIDEQAPDYQLLASGVKSGIEVVELNPNSDGVQQIADFLAAHPDPSLTTVDIVAHGSDGMLFLGNTVLDNATVGQYASQLAQIGKALQPGGDLMLYGCDVATDASGLIFLDQITQETGVNVAASTGPVGSAAEGGTWTLDASSGLITAVSPFTAATMAAYSDVLNADIFSVITGGLADGILYGTDNNGGGDGAASGVTNDYSGNNTNNAVFQASEPVQIQLDPQDGLYFVLLDDSGQGGPNKIIELSLTALLNNPSSPAAVVATPFQDTNTNDSANAFYVDVADNVIFVNDIINNNLDNPTPTADDLDVLTFSGAHFSGTVTTTTHNLGAEYLNGMVVDPLSKTAYFYFTETSETIVGPHGGTTGGLTSNGVKIPGNPTGTPGQQKDVFVITENALFQASWNDGTNTNLGTVTLTQLPISGNGSQVPSTDGIIEDLAVDNATGTLYFDTDSANSSSAGIYSYNATSHAISTVYTTNGAVNGGLTNFIIDPQTNKYYVTTVNGSTNDIYDGSLTGGNPSLFINVDTVDGALADGGAVGMALDNSPVLTTSGTTVTADQDGPAVTINGAGITITDSDTTQGGDNSELASATVSITTNFETGDTLAVPTADLSGTNITQSYNSATGVLTLSGVDTIAHYQTVLDDVTFSTTSGVGLTPRTVTFAASDGLLSASGTDTVHVLVLPVVGATGNTVDFYQSQEPTPTTLDGSITVTDGNGDNITGATATITNSELLSGDTLAIPSADLTGNTITGTSITESYSGGVLTLSGTDTAAHYQQALRDVTYDFSGDPTNAGADKTRTVTWSVTDTDNLTSIAGTATTLDTFVTPVLAAGAGFTAPVMNSNGALAADSDLTVSDVNTDGSAPVATVTISSGFDTGDTLSYNGGTAHTFTDGGQITGTFVAGTHILTLTGTAGTSAADFQAAFEAVQFNTTNTNSNNGTRTLTWVFNDDAGNHANTSNSLTTNFNVEFPPAISNTGNTAEFYQNQASPTPLDSAITVTDPNVAVTSATVTISSGFLSGDTLTFNNGSTTETFGDGSVITAAQSGDVLTLTTTTGTSTAADYQTALESVTYSFTGDPTNAGADKVRTITWSATDANNQTSVAGSTTTLDTFVVPVLAAGAGFSAPVMTTSGAVAADSDLTVADVNTSGSAPAATVTISNGFDTGDTLSYNGGTAHTFTDGGQITGTFNAGTHALTLTGTAGTSAADFQAALEAVQFNTTNTNSNNGTRTLTWQFNDDAGNNTNTSNSLTTNFNVEFPPTVGNTGNTAEFYQNQASATLLDGAITVTDPNVAVTSATVTISSGFLSGDTLTFNNGSTTESFGDGSVITAAQSGNTLTLTTTTGTSTAADYQTALESVTYSFTGDPTNAGADKTRTISWSVTDANTETSAAGGNSTLDVYALPIVSAGAAGTPTETTISGPVIADNTLTITDYNGTTIHDASVQITSGDVASDTLTINGTTSGTINDGASGTITYSFTGSTLTLTGTDTVTDYQNALDLVKFSAVSPNSGTRTLTWEVNDQAGGNTNDSAPVTTNVDVVFGPQVTAGATATFDGGSATPVTLDGTLTVTDAANPTITSAAVSISSGFLSGDTLTINGTTSGTINDGANGTIAYSFSGSTLSLTGSDTVADYQSALELVQYNFTPTNGDPTNGGGDTSRTISWTATDAASQSDIPASTSTLDVVHVAPSVTAGGTATFTGGSGTPVTLDGTLTTSDADSGGNLAGATVSISSGFITGDTLTINGTTSGIINDGASGTITYSLSGSTLTLTGTDTVADYQSALELVQYSFTPSNGDPTAAGTDTARTISWTVTDGSTSNGTSNTATSTLDTVHVAPVVTAGGTATFDGGGAAVTLDGTLTTSDADSGGNLAGATVSITSGFITGDTLTINGTTSGTINDGANGTITYSFSGSTLTLTGTDTAADYQSALESVQYSFTPSNGDPTAAGTDTARTISWTVTDGSTSNGTSNTATSTLDTVHVAPVVTAGGTPTFTGGGSAVTLDGTLAVTDADSGDNLAGATVSITSGFVTGDTLTINGTTSGTINDGANGTITYSFSGSTLTLSGTDTVEDYRSALQSVQYSFTPSNGDPTNGETDTSRTISWTVTDGSTSNGTSNTSTSTLDTTHTPPTVTAGASATFDGGGSPVTLDSTVTVTDPDSNGNLSSAFVNVNSGFVTGDTLTINGTTSGTINDGANGTINYSFSGSTLTLTGTDTVADYQSALQSVQYSFSPSNGDPTNGGSATSRTFTWTADDGESSATGGSTLTVVHVAPTVTAGGSATFDGGSSPVTLDGTLAVADVDSGGNLAGATVSISSGFLTGDTLTINGTTSGTINDGANGTINYSFSGSTLTLTGTDTVADYKSALELVQYSFSPSNGDPTNAGVDASRTISWTVTDGSTSNGTSNTDTSTLDTVHVAPVVTAGATATFELTGPAVAADNTLSLTDVDSNGNLTGATVSITSGLDAADDALHFTNQNGISGSYDSATGVLTLTGNATVADYQTALDSITFSSATGSTGTRSLSWTVTDGSASNGTSNTDTSTIDLVVGPQITAGATATFDGGSTTPVTLDGTLAVSDSAHTDLTSATVSISSGFITGDTLTINGTTSGTINDGANGTISYSLSGSTLTLTGTDTVADYKSALELVQYSFTPSNGDPTNGGGDIARTISWTATDSVASSTAVTSTLDVVHVAPSVTAGGTATFTGGSGTPVTLDGTLTTSDADSGGNLTGATVSITSGFITGDTLTINGTTSGTINDGANGTISYSFSGSTLSLTGTDTVADYKSALELVQYSFTPSNGDPTNGGGDTARTISWTVTDGSTSNGTSNTATSTLDTVHVAPSVTAGATATFDGGGSPVTLDGTLAVTDADSAGNLSGATVSITSGFSTGDTLTINGTTNGTINDGANGTISYSFSGSTLTLTGTDTVADYKSALELVQYSFTPSNGDPTAAGTDTARTISWTVTDGSTSNGTSNTATSVLETVHTPPTVIAGASATFDGGGSPVTLDGTLAVTDADSAGNLSGATVSITSGFTTGDTLTINGTTSGTINDGANGTISYSFAGTTLTLSGTDTVADYKSALELVQYSFTPSNGDPTNGGGDTARTIRWQVSDGSTSNGTSIAKTSTLDVVHEPPTVTAGATVTLTQNSTSTQSAIVLDGALTLADPDSNGLLTGATVSISSGFLDNAQNTDVLSFTNQNGITGSYDAVHGVLTLSGTATVGQYQTALESITFNSIGPNPTNDGADLTRTISWTVTDGNTSNGHATATSTVDVQAFPTVVAGASVNYQAGLFSEPVKLDATVGVYDDTNITSATVSLGSGFQIGDILLASTSGTNVHALYNPLTGVMTLSGTDTPQHYDQVMQSITFSSAQLNNGTVTVDWHVTDQNNLTSKTQTSDIHVKSALFPVIGNLTNNPVLPPTSPHSGYDNFSPTFITFSNDNGGASFGNGQSVIPLHADVTVNVADNGAIDFNAPLGVLEASLDGDVVSITATLQDGQPLPDWLHFNAETGKFAGIVPDNLTGTGSLPHDGGNTGGNQGGLVPDKLTVEVVATNAKGDIAIIDFTINLKPDNGTHHGWNLPGDLRNLAPIELPHQHAQFLPHHGLPGPLLAAGGGHDHGAGHALAGRAGLSRQLAAHGLHGMHADRMALLESLRHATAGHG
jgi:Domain of unknown function (DUF4347)